MTSTTGTSIESYLEWVRREVEKKDYGEVSICFTICNRQLTMARKGSFDNDKFELKKKGE